MNHYRICILLIALNAIFSCIKFKELATLTTNDTSNPTINSVTSGGNITNGGSADITARGVCWSTSQSPTTAGSHTTDGTGTGSFTSSITGLDPDTKYYIRAYATNSAGTAYGNEVSFKTIALTAPTLTTFTATEIGSTTAKSGGTISSDGGDPITSKGVCWSTSTNPTTNDSKTSDGSGSAAFISDLKGLTPNTTYYIRAYATNSAGTSYGSELVLTTFAATDRDGNNYTSVTIGTQIWLRENLMTTKFNDGVIIPNVDNTTTWYGLTTPAYCWYREDESDFKVPYGALYNWYIVDPANNGNKNVCPSGWHVPSDSEWGVLITYLGGESVAGGKLKEAGFTHWSVANTDATNESGFTALPGGEITNELATPISLWARFRDVGMAGHWWSTTADSQSTSRSLGVGIYDYIGIASRTIGEKGDGWSIRCLKDY